MVGRAIAGILLAMALIVAGHDALNYWQTGTYDPLQLGTLWYQVDRASLNLVQAVVERHLHPVLWQDVIFPLLVWPAWLVLGGLAVLFGLLSGPRRPRRRRGFG
ncbi:MAG TPA: hypothetical protein VMH36_26755 [Alphaproteobacteria bacterium]|nr:hypothetical protein [Alphaproteobacteria bacterium]